MTCTSRTSPSCWRRAGALRGGSLDPGGPRADQGPRADLHLRGLREHPGRPVRAALRAGRDFLGSLPVPRRSSRAPGGGVRQNLGFESAGVPPNGRFLFVATENALVQDGPAATVAGGSPARILRYHLPNGRLDRQWVYETDPVAEPPVPATSSRSTASWSCCRSTTVPARDGALVLRRRARHRQHDPHLPGRRCRPRRRQRDKTLLLDLDDLGIPLDNVEGMTFGPRLPDGAGRSCWSATTTSPRPSSRSSCCSRSTSGRPRSRVPRVERVLQIVGGGRMGEALLGGLIAAGRARRSRWPSSRWRRRGASSSRAPTRA